MTREQAARLVPGDRALVYDRSVPTVLWATSRGGVKVRQDGRERWLPFGEVERAG